MCAKKKKNLITSQFLPHRDDKENKDENLKEEEENFSFFFANG